MAAASELPPELVALADAVERANAGDRAGAVKRLDRLIADHPDMVDARVVRGVNHYLLGHVAEARADLATCFSDESWSKIEVRSENFTKVTTEITTVDLGEQRMVGAGMLIVLDARDGRFSEAGRLIERSQATFGDGPQLQAASARLALAEGDGATAWKRLGVALAAIDPTLFVQSVASEMVALDPESAPDAVTDALDRAGQWTATYNKARGHVMGRRYPACVAVVKEALGRHDEPRLLALGYTCAARSDPAQAEVWLDALGGAGRAPPQDVLAHARTLAGQDRRADALALVDRLPRKLPDDLARARQILRLEALVALDRLDDAVKISDGTTAPASEAQLAHKLVLKSRFAEARAILEKACPAMRGEEGDKACRELLAYARDREAAGG